MATATAAKTKLSSELGCKQARDEPSGRQRGEGVDRGKRD
jgi:hypothetical protein